MVLVALTANESERKNAHIDAHHKKMQENMVELYEEHEDLEPQYKRITKEEFNDHDVTMIGNWLKDINAKCHKYSHCCASEDSF